MRAVAYVRMSTDHQKYSTENQLDAISRYAEDRDLKIIRVYEDAGRSGLRLHGREALQRLMADVSSGGADFSAILVYDVSRWDLYQDTDETRTMNTFARAPASGFTIAPRNSRTAVRSAPTCSSRSNGSWLAKTAGSYR